MANFQWMKWMALGLLLVATGLVFGADDDGWQRVYTPRDWQFPRDHGAHSEFKTEWWYVTGNVTDADGRPFGYQLTIFRQGLQITPVQKESKWAIRDFIFGHFAVSDVVAGKFHALERVDRGALGLSGADAGRMNVWLHDWKIETPSPKIEKYRLVASEPDMAVDLILWPGKPLTLQGDRGVSRKTLTPGNASHYYSYTRLQTEGTVRVGKTSFTVKGTSWFDHEFSTSALGPEQAGWDWFSIALDSGDELMLYQMRNKDGTVDLASQGTWIPASGKKELLARDDFQITVLDTWKSPRSGATYPARWRVVVPKLQVELEVTPALRDQELYLMELSKIAYWEGACRASGTRAGKKVNGTGYTELTGYAQALGKY